LEKIPIKPGIKEASVKAKVQGPKKEERRNSGAFAASGLILKSCYDFCKDNLKEG
jgi:hypothetical protein